jgi:hypothetical protein
MVVPCRDRHLPASQRGFQPLSSLAAGIYFQTPYQAVFARVSAQRNGARFPIDRDLARSLEKLVRRPRSPAAPATAGLLLFTG